MWKTNKNYETPVKVINQAVATRGSGELDEGLGWIATGVEIEDVMCIWMPDLETFIWNDQGKFVEKRAVVHVSHKTWDNVPFIVGRTFIEKDNLKYRVVKCFDYSDHRMIGAVEIEVVRRINVE